MPVRGILGLALAAALAGCGSSAARTQADTGPHTSPAIKDTHVLPHCPRPQPRYSSPGAPDALAPGAPHSTSFCVYSQNRPFARAAYRGGPLDDALNSSMRALPPNTACSAVARLPAVVILRYGGGAQRHLVLDMGGCPALITSSGARRYLPTRATTLLLQDYLVANRHRITP